MTTTDELIARFVILESEAVQARQRQSSAEHALAVPQQRNQQLCFGDGATSTSVGVIDTRTLGKPKSFTGQTAKWDNVAIHVQGMRVRSASEDAGSLRPRYTERLRACGQQ